MPRQGRAHGKARHNRQKIVLTLAILGAVISLAVFMPALSAFVGRRMEALRDDLLHSLEENLGCEVAYESIAPSFLKALEFRGLSLQDASGEAFLHVSKLSVYYRLDKLLTGKIAEAPSRMSIIGLTVRIDRAREGGLPAIIKRLSSRGGSDRPFRLPETFRLSFRDLSIEYVDAGLSATVSSADLDVLVDQGGLEFSGRLPILFSTDYIPRTRILAEAEGRAEKDFSAMRSTIEARASSDDFSILNQKVLLSYRDGLLELRKVQDRAPIDLFASVDMASGDFRAELDFARFKVSALGSFRGKLSSLAVARDISLTGRGSLKGNIRQASFGLSYDLDARAALPDAILPGSAVVDVSITGDWRLLTMEKIELSSRDGAVSWTGAYDFTEGLPEGDLSAAYVWKGLRLEGDALLRAQGPRRLSIFSESFRIGGSEILSLSFHLIPGPGKLDLGLEGFFAQGEYQEEKMDREEEFLAAEAIPTQALSRFEIGGSWYGGKSAFLELNASLSSLPGSFIADIINPITPLPANLQSLSRDLLLSSEAWFSTDFKRVSYNVPELILSLRGSGGSYALASLTGSAGNLEVDNLSVFWPGHQLQSSLFMDFYDPREITLDADISLDGIAYGLTGMILEGRRFSFSGEHGLSLSGSIEGSEARFGLSLESFPLPLGAFVPRLSLEAAGRFRNLDDWSVSASSSRLEQRSGLLPSYAEIGFSGDFDQDGGRLSRISLKDDFSTVTGDAELAWTLHEPYSSSINLSLGDQSGRESYSLSAAMAGSAVSGRLVLSDAPVARIAGTGMRGFLSGEASLSGFLPSPRIGFKADLSRSEILELPLEAKVAGEWAEGLLRLDSLSGNLWILSLLQGKGSYRPSEGKLNLGSTMRISLGQSLLDAELLLDGTAKEGFSLDGTARGVTLAGYRADSWPLSLAEKGGAWTFRAGDRGQINATMNAQGIFALKFAPPLGIRGTMEGRILDGTIDARAPDLVFDMPVIWKIFGGHFMDFPTGLVRASVSASGNVKDPELSGRAMAENISIRIPDFLRDSYGPVSLPMVLESNSLKASGISLSGGGGTILGDMSIDFERWLPQVVRVDCRTEAGKPVRVDMIVGNIDAEGSAEGSLNISVTPRQLDLRGSFDATESTITLASQRPEEAPSDWPILADIQIRVGRKVEFVWPSRQVPWLRSYLEPGSRLDVGMDSRTGDFSLKGDARLRGGEVFYFRRSFYVREGIMTFNEDENSFDPYITIRADMRDQDERGPVLITMKAERNRLSSFRPRLSSSPTHTEDEILAMLGQAAIGGTPQEGQEASTVTGGLVSAAGDALAQFTGVRYFENTVRDTFNLDLFSVRSQLLQNVVLGATLANTSLGGTSLGNASSPGVYFDNTTIMAGKYLGADLFLLGTVQMSNDPEAYLGNLDVDLEFSIEWNTPFFRIMWDFFPQNAHNLFVNDQSLGIYWDWSY